MSTLKLNKQRYEDMVGLYVLVTGTDQSKKKKKKKRQNQEELIQRQGFPLPIGEHLFNSLV